MIISRSIYIAAPIDRVFSLVVNPRKRTQLNPTVDPITVEVEDGEPLHVGSRCHYRLQVGRRIVDYRAKIAAIEPNYRIVSVTETKQPIEIEVRTIPEENGTRLVQSEAFEPTELMLESAVQERRSGLRSFVDRILVWVDSDSAFARRKHQEQALQDLLEGNLARWLEAIKRHLEETESGPRQSSRDEVRPQG